MCAISSLTSTFAISSPDEFLFHISDNNTFVALKSCISNFYTKLVVAHIDISSKMERKRQRNYKKLQNRRAHSSNFSNKVCYTVSIVDSGLVRTL